MKEWLILAIFMACFTATVQQIDENQCMIENTAGCPKSRPPIYMVIVPRKVRPNQIIQVFASILRLEYSHINVRISIVRDNVEYAGTVMKFDRPSSRIMQLLMPQNAKAGQYKLRVEGTLNGGLSGYIFKNESDILFDSKQASLFIQMSKPIYKQGQLVQFRVIPILPNMMPKYGSLTIYIDDPTGIPVRRWLGLQTNAGGLVSQSFQLSDQPNYGNWTIRCDAFGHTYKKMFTVEEFWTPRFDVNVTVPPYVNNTAMNISGVVLANQTSGRPVIGNASITLYFKPPDSPDDGDYPYLYRFFNYHKGRIDFMFTMDEIKELAYRRLVGNLVDSELIFEVNVTDWDSDGNRYGKASTIIFDSKIKLKWVGERVRTFKPNSVLTVAVAVMNFDGTPVTSNNQIVRLYPSISNSGPASPRQDNPIMVQPVNGIAEFRIFANSEAESILLEADFLGDEEYAYNVNDKRIQLRASRYESPSNSYITIETSTKHAKVNEYMIFHVKTSNFVPRIFYQVISGGNIIIGDELEMTSRQKTFSLALSREMIPTARIVVFYIRQPEEVVVDVLNFFVNGTRQNEVKLTVNRGKDFSRDTVEFNAYADPGSYVAFAAMPYDLYIRGLNDGISENNLIDELATYDEPARGSYRHLWRISDTEYEYKFYHANGYGIDANTTFLTAGLLVLTDARLDRVQNVDMCLEINGFYPCFTGTSQCFTADQRCDKVYDCTDGADEWDCVYEEDRNMHLNAMDRVSRIDRFFDDSSWAWQEIFVKPDGRVDFRVDVPKYPLAWVINGLSVSREIGLGIMQSPVIYDAARYMYIQVETPDVIVRGEQVGVRVTVFNYWHGNDYIEVLITVHDDPQYDFVVVEDMGIVEAYSPRTHSGDHQTILFLEPGESKDIYMPIVPKIVKGQFDLKVSASCFMERDFVKKTITVIPDGIINYYHTPYLIDLIRFGALSIPDFDVNVPERFVVPEQREHLYVPGSTSAQLSLFGDVVTPGFFEDYLNAENILRRPYGAGEMITFNFAYNMLTLRFMKTSQQLTDETLSIGLSSMNVAMQRQLSYMHKDGYFFMFRDDPVPSIWLTAFAAKTFHSARFGEWERELFIPLELINRMVVWLCDQQNKTTGAWDSDEAFASDRKMASFSDIKTQQMYTDSTPLTAYVLIALYEASDVSGDALNCIDTAKSSAANYLSNIVDDIDSNEIFHLAITAYALSLSQEKSREAFNRLWSLRRTSDETYFADQEVPANPTDIINNIRFLYARDELMNEGYAIQSTAYALMAHINNNGVRYERNSMMNWLQTMRNTIGGFASTQDTLVAMEALFKYTQVDPNRNVFDMMVQFESTATPNWLKKNFINKMNYTSLTSTYLPTVWGNVKILTQGTGRALTQLTVTKNVEHEGFLKPTQLNKETDERYRYFDLMLDYKRYSGRNSSIMEMRPCISWIFTERSFTSGLTVLEVDVPTGYVIMNDTLRQYVQSKVVPNLKRAEFYGRKVVFYFNYVDSSRTCVYFRANRWYPVANNTIQHRMRVYDYYEPGMHNTTFYTTYGLHNLNICFVCGSYQCPYCPWFNMATVLKSSITFLCLILGFFTRYFILRS